MCYTLLKADFSFPPGFIPGGVDQTFFMFRKSFDTGILKEEKGLREDVFVCLDLFRRKPPVIDGQMKLLDRWLTFLSETDAERILQLLEQFPEFRELYGEIADFVRKPEELMEMHSDILRVLERNTERNMVTDLQGEVQERDNIIREQGEQLQKQGEQIRKKDEQLQKKEEQLREMQLRLIKQLQTKINNGKSLSEIADDLVMEEQEIAPWYEKIVSLGPDKDAQEILISLLHFN